MLVRGGWGEGSARRAQDWRGRSACRHKVLIDGVLLCSTVRRLIWRRIEGIGLRDMNGGLLAAEMDTTNKI